MNDKVLDNVGWQARLRAVPGLESCELPESYTDDPRAPRIDIRGTKEQVVITLNAAAASDNMQKDASAFEPWSLALIEHCGVKSVIVGSHGDYDGTNFHCNRFMYRLGRISELVDLISPSSDVHRALPVGIDWVLNQSGHRSVPVAVGNPWLMMQRVKNVRGEKALEMGLEASLSFRERFDLSNVMRQWPVGLYKGSVTDATGHFPGDASQIDLLGVSGEDLYLFELKVGDETRDNKKAGALSEVFFYACVMRDALLNRFRYERLSAARNCDVSPVDVLRCKRIKAVLLKQGPQHCLLEKPGILTRLNKEMAAKWSDLPVEFESARITEVPCGFGSDFRFA